MESPTVDAARLSAAQAVRARIKGVFGLLIFVVGTYGLTVVWHGLHTVFTYSAVWPLGLAITGIGFILDAGNTLRTRFARADQRRDT